jgi:hypothetical protein
VSPGEQSHFLSFLKENKIHFTVLNDNVQKWVTELRYVVLLICCLLTRTITANHVLPILFFGCTNWRFGIPHIKPAVGNYFHFHPSPIHITYFPKIHLNILSHLLLGLRNDYCLTISPPK